MRPTWLVGIIALATVTSALFTADPSLLPHSSSSVADTGPVLASDNADGLMRIDRVVAYGLYQPALYLPSTPDDGPRGIGGMLCRPGADAEFGPPDACVVHVPGHVERLEVRFHWETGSALGAHLAVVDPDGHRHRADDHGQLVLEGDLAGVWTVEARPIGPVTMWVWSMEMDLLVPDSSVESATPDDEPRVLAGREVSSGTDSARGLWCAHGCTLFLPPNTSAVAVDTAAFGPPGSEVDLTYVLQQGERRYVLDEGQSTLDGADLGGRWALSVDDAPPGTETAFFAEFRPLP